MNRILLLFAVCTLSACSPRVDPQPTERLIDEPAIKVRGIEHRPAVKVATFGDSLEANDVQLSRSGAFVRVSLFQRDAESSASSTHHVFDAATSSLHAVDQIAHVDYPSERVITKAGDTYTFWDPRRTTHRSFDAQHINPKHAFLPWADGLHMHFDGGEGFWYQGDDESTIMWSTLDRTKGSSHDLGARLLTRSIWSVRSGWSVWVAEAPNTSEPTPDLEACECSETDGDVSCARCDHRCILLPPGGGTPSIFETLALPLTRDTYIRFDEQQKHITVERFSDKQEIPLPEGCDVQREVPFFSFHIDMLTLFDTTQSAWTLLSCGQSLARWNPSTGALVPIDESIVDVPRQVAGSDGEQNWVGVVSSEGDQLRLGRMSLETGELEHVPGPLSTERVRGPYVWDDAILLASQGSLRVLNVASGESGVLNDPHISDIAGLVVSFSDERTSLLSLKDFTLTPIQLDGANLSRTSEAGCYLTVAASASNLDRGPWTLWCPGAAEPK